MHGRSPTSQALSLFAGFAVPGLVTWGYAVGLGFSPLITWLAAVNLMVVALLGKDKFAATRKRSRTPEITLLALTFAGGTIGMLVGRHVFNHKTSKSNFIAAMWGAIALQAACIWYFWAYFRSLL